MLSEHDWCSFFLWNNVNWWVDHKKTRNNFDFKVQKTVWRSHMLDVCVICKEGGRKKSEARQEHLSVLRPVWWGVVLVCSRPTQKSAGPVNLAQLCCLFGLTQRSPRALAAARWKQLLSCSKKSVTNIYHGGNAKAWPSASQTAAIKFAAHSWISRPFKLCKIYALPLLMRSCCQRLLAIYPVNVWISRSHSSESCAVI